MATSKEGTPENLDFWARKKGISLIGTGDFTHPVWREELKERLVTEGNGLYRLRDEYVKEERTKTYSKLYDKIEYTKGLDNYNKYGTIRDDLGILCNTYNIPYNEYNHLYKKITDFHLDEKLKLSYTSFQKYNECGFKYYLDNILKINPFENTFSSMIGSLVHSVLENNLKNNISVDEIIDNFIRENELSNKEVFFASKLKEDLKGFIRTKCCN